VGEYVLFCLSLFAPPGGRQCERTGVGRLWHPASPAAMAIPRSASMPELASRGCQSPNLRDMRAAVGPWRASKP